MLGSAMGLGLLAGVRLYATVFTLGLAIRMGWFELGSSFSNLNILAETPVLALSGTAFAIEFLADKIPWVDSVWDSVHTFIRPVGAAALGATALGSFDPTTKTLIALLCGGIAFTGHTSKAATRLVANHSPEPFSNAALSFAEDLAIPAGLWIAFEHPILALSIVCAFLLLFAWLSPKIFRLLRVSWTALKGLIGRAFGSGPQPVPPAIPDTIAGTLRRALEELPFQQAPSAYAAKAGNVAAVGVHCAATKTVPGLKNSTGYLFVNPSEVVFVARRFFRLKAYRMSTDAIQGAGLRRGMFLDPLVLNTADREIGFDVFKGRRIKTRAGEFLRYSDA